MERTVQIPTAIEPGRSVLDTWIRRLRLWGLKLTKTLFCFVFYPKPSDMCIQKFRGRQMKFIYKTIFIYLYLFIFKYCVHWLDRSHGAGK